MRVFPTRVLAAVAVALLLLAATGAATASNATTPTRDGSTILVKWHTAAPSAIPAVGDLKTKVKIVKVPTGWTVDQTITFYRSLPGVDFAEANYVAGQNAVTAPNDPLYSQQWGLARIGALQAWGIYPGSHATANNARGIAGLAHGAKLIPVKVVGAAQYQLTIAAQNGFDGNVSLAVSGLPAGATSSFAPASVPASGSSTLTVSTAGGTPAGSYPLTVQATSGSLTHSVTTPLAITVM